MRRLGCEVVPRLTTAHNHIWRSLGVYRFLCALQWQQVVPGIKWDWGPLGSAPFLPRVVSGRVILSRARWNLGEGELAAFREPRGAAMFAAVFCSFFATMDDPVPAINNFMRFTLWSAPVSALYVLVLLPLVHDFGMFVLVAANDLVLQ